MADQIPDRFRERHQELRGCGQIALQPPFQCLFITAFARRRRPDRHDSPIEQVLSQQPIQRPEFARSVRGQLLPGVPFDEFAQPFAQVPAPLRDRVQFARRPAPGPKPLGNRGIYKSGNLKPVDESRAVLQPFNGLARGRRDTVEKIERRVITDQ